MDSHTSTCPSCGRHLPLGGRFCIHCGKPLAASLLSPDRPIGGLKTGETMNLPILYAMVAGLLLALLVPPWETPPGPPPAFLGFHFFWDPPASLEGGAPPVESRVLLTVELVTIAVAGLYLAWLFRGREPG